MTADAYPEWLAAWSKSLVVPSGQLFLLRVVHPGDVDLLTKYFLGLSDCTRMLYAPHAFDRETAGKLCAERDPAVIRLVTVEGGGGGPDRVGSYFILFLAPAPGDTARYSDTPLEGTCSLAPSVRDDLQGSGLASLVMKEVVELARRLGMRRMILCGGVQARNQRACRFYEKWGFARVREFPSQIMNVDMMRDL